MQMFVLTIVLMIVLASVYQVAPLWITAVLIAALAFCCGWLLMD